MVGTPTEHEHRRLGQIGGDVGAGQHQRAPALRRHGAVEQVEGVGDHAAVENVLGRERPPPVVDRLGVDVPVVADGRGDGGQRFGGRAVDLHVPTGHEGELGRGEHPERGDELVRRPGPRGGGVPFGVRAGGSRRDEDGRGEAGGDGRCGLEHRRDPGAGHRPPHGPDPVLVDEVGGAAGPDHPVDVARREPGVGDRPQGRPHGDGLAVVVLQHAGLPRVEDAHDGYVAQWVSGHVLLRPFRLMPRPGARR